MVKTHKIKNILIGIFITLSSITWSQEQIKTKISAKNIFELSIINIYPEEYPKVSVIFQAKNKYGKPLWMLDKSEMVIEENGSKCDILKLINITTKKPLNIGLVFDHSGSMVDNPEQMPKGMKTMQDLYFEGIPFPKGYIMPIEYAKKGVNSFIELSHGSEDSVLFIGFSSEVDKILPLTNDLNQIRSFINSVEPGGRTAFYDALYESITKLKTHNSQPVIVAITDGQDNESKHSYSEVISYAKKEKIPIYIIGLGDVDQYYLQDITSATNGFFYYTNDPNQLVSIYKNIKEQLRSIYQVDYTSTSTDYLSEDRTLKFSFLNDTMTFSNSEAKFSLSKEAMDYLEKKEQDRQRKIEEIKAEEQNKNILLGGIAVTVLLVGISSFLIVRKRKQTLLKIEKVYPNPFSDQVKIKYFVDQSLENPELQMVDLSGNKVMSQLINPSEQEIMIESYGFNPGIYLFIIVAGDEKSNELKVVKE